MPSILLNEASFHFSETDFPLFIHGIEHSGSSFFTLALLVDLYNENKKFVFFSKSEKAQINFLQLLIDQTRIGKVLDQQSIEHQKNQQGILINSSDNALFLETIKNIEEDRIIVIKNIDSMPEEIFNSVKDKKNIVISGNIDRCIYKEKILENQWSTKILFSNLETIMANILPIEQYEAIFLGQKTSGVISIK